jgi:hypothetical protein
LLLFPPALIFPKSILPKTIHKNQFVSRGEEWGKLPEHAGPCAFCFCEDTRLSYIAMTRSEHDS